MQSGWRTRHRRCVLLHLLCGPKGAVCGGYICFIAETWIGGMDCVITASLPRPEKGIGGCGLQLANLVRMLQAIIFSPRAFM